MKQIEHHGDDSRVPAPYTLATGPQRVVRRTEHVGHLPAVNIVQPPQPTAALAQQPQQQPQVFYISVPAAPPPVPPANVSRVDDDGGGYLPKWMVIPLVVLALGVMMAAFYMTIDGGDAEMLAEQRHELALERAEQRHELAMARAGQAGAVRGAQGVIVSPFPFVQFGYVAQ